MPFQRQLWKLRQSGGTGATGHVLAADPGRHAKDRRHLPSRQCHILRGRLTTNHSVPPRYNRRHWFPLVDMMRIPICFALLALGLIEGLVAAPPNVVLIISDDQSWTDYGFMGHELIQTPNLDRLAAESMVFRHGYVPTALCRPSLMSLSTGLYAHQHRTSGNDPAETPANARHVEQSGKTARELLISHIDKYPTLPKLLGDLGYLSHQSGKWWEGSYRRGGFTHGMTRGYPEKGGRHGDDGLAIGREPMDPVFDFIDLAVEDEKPFFVWYAPFLPHTPHNPPERLLRKYRDKGLSEPVAKYYAMCEWFDETCGRLLDHLGEKGVAANTLVAYVTDNGWIQRPDRNGYAPRSKRSPYEGGVRTPIMFRWPGTIAPGEREELVSSIDIVPTILNAAGAKVPDNLPGLDLMPVLRDGQALDRDAIFGEAFAHDIADIETPDTSLLFRWVIADGWKLILTYDGRQGRMVYPPTEFGPQLFKLKDDPHEQNNLAGQESARVNRLSRRIAEWWSVTERKHGAPGS
jgi:arylsulfatase A-like enzyme